VTYDARFSRTRFAMEQSSSASSTAAMLPRLESDDQMVDEANPNHHPRLDYAEYLWELQLPKHLRVADVGEDGEEVERVTTPTSRVASTQRVSLDPGSARRAEVMRQLSFPDDTAQSKNVVAALDQQIAGEIVAEGFNTPADMPRPSLWDGFRYIREATFGVALGVAATPGAWNMANRTYGFYDATTADRLGLIGAAVGLLNLVFYIPKVFLFLDDVREVLNHPTASSAFGLCGMALMTASGGFLPYSEPISTLLWYAGFCSYLLTTWHFLTRQKKRIINPFTFANIRDQLVPLMIIPCVGIEVGAISGRSIKRPRFVDDFCLFAGIVGGLTMHLAVMIRIFFGKPLPDDVFPTTFIMLAPKFLILAAWLKINPDDKGSFVQFMFYFGLFSYCVNMRFLIKRLVKNKGSIPYSPAFAAFTFPFAITTVGTFMFYESFGYEWVRYIGLVFLSQLTLHVTYVQLRYFHDYSRIFHHTLVRSAFSTMRIGPSQQHYPPPDEPTEHIMTRYAENIYVHISSEEHGGLLMVQKPTTVSSSSSAPSDVGRATSNHSTSEGRQGGARSDPAADARPIASKGKRHSQRAHTERVSVVDPHSIELVEALPTPSLAPPSSTSQVPSGSRN